jgi:hypothetical protein
MPLAGAAILVEKGGGDALVQPDELPRYDQIIKSNVWHRIRVNRSARPHRQMFDPVTPSNVRLRPPIIEDIMTKIVAFIFLLALSLAACTRSSSPPGNPFPGQPSIVGKWTIINVTTYAYDSAGLRNNGVQVYPGQPYYFYQFNADKSWLESLVPDSLSDLGITGTYAVTSDSTFTLTNLKAITPNTPCSILYLTDTSFSFSHQHSTVFNGTDSGYIKYVFHLRK